MSGEKFTPGPWKMTGENGRKYVRGSGKYITQRDHRYQSKSEIERISADCALIAAAPDLYELLAAADTLIIWESMGFTNEFADRVEAALAKARGESC